MANEFYNLTPGEAIRKFCVSCVGSYSDVHGCKGDKLLNGQVCSFFKYRLGTGRPSVKTIRKECLRCTNGSMDLVRECNSQTCQVHQFRMGHNPRFSQESRDSARERAKFSLKIKN